MGATTEHGLLIVLSFPFLLQKDTIFCRVGLPKLSRGTPIPGRICPTESEGSKRRSKIMALLCPCSMGVHQGHSKGVEVPSGLYLLKLAALGVSRTISRVPVTMWCKSLSSGPAAHTPDYRDLSPAHATSYSFFSGEDTSGSSYDS